MLQLLTMCAVFTTLHLLVLYPWRLEAWGRKEISSSLAANQAEWMESVCLSKTGWMLHVYVALFDQENANGQQFGRQAIETLASKDPSRKKIVAVWSTEKRLSEMSRTSQLEKMKPREWAKRHEVSQPAGHVGWLSRQRHQHGQAAGCMSSLECSTASS